MRLKIEKSQGASCVIVQSDEIVISNVSSALDFMMSISSETGCDCIALNKEAIHEDFFVLSTGLAGEILQKFINHRMKFAVIGDFSQYTSKALQAFIYESNQGRDIFFVSLVEEAIEKFKKSY